MKNIPTLEEFVNESSLNEGAFSVLNKKQNGAAKEIVKCIKKQEKDLSTSAILELLDIFKEDIKKGGYSALDSFLK